MATPSQSLRTGDALLVVDVQIDFCPGGNLPIPEGDAVVPVLNRWIRACADKALPVCFSRDWHPARHMSFRDQGGAWPPHCLQDSEGARLHPGLLIPRGAILVTKGVRFDKDQNSAFDDTGLETQLAREGVGRVWVGGLALEVCVKASALDAIRLGFQAGLILDATRPVEADAGERALQEMTGAGVRVETTT